MSVRRSQRLLEKVCSGSMDILDEMASEKLLGNQNLFTAKDLPYLNNAPADNINDQRNKVSSFGSKVTKRKRSRRNATEERQTLYDNKTVQKKNNRKITRSNSIGGMAHGKSKPTISAKKIQNECNLSVCGYVKNAPVLKTSQIERYFDNNTHHKPTILPAVYPSHFINQMPHGSQSLDTALYVATKQHRIQRNVDIYSPANFSCTCDELECSASTLSLSDSLRDIFQVDDIRELFSMEKVVYRLCDHHVSALAMVLNLNVKILITILDALVHFSVETVDQIKNDFQSVDQRAGQCCRESRVSSTSNDSVIQSSPTIRTVHERYFPSQRRTQ